MLLTESGSNISRHTINIFRGRYVRNAIINSVGWRMARDRGDVGARVDIDPAVDEMHETKECASCRFNAHESSLTRVQ